MQRNGRGDTRGQIYEATEELLAEVPLHELSVAQIIDRAGVSRATFYFYCSSKFAVVEGLLTEIMDEIYDVARPFIDRAEDDAPDAALRRSLEACAALWRKHRVALRAVSEHWNTVPELRDLWLGVVRKFTDGVAAEVERQRAAGVAPEGVPTRKLVLALLWATERSFYVAGLDVDPGFDGEEDAVAALYAIWHGAIYGARVPAFES